MTGTKPMTSLTKRAGILVVAAFTLLLGAFATLPAAAQEVSPEHLDAARKYVQLTDQSGIYEAALVQVAIESYRTLLPQNPEIATPLNDAITKTLDEYKLKKSELFDQFARVYALSFTIEELNEIVAFYESPTGAKLTKANARLNSSIKRVLNVYEQNLKGEFFAKVRAELKAKGFDT